MASSSSAASAASLSTNMKTCFYCRSPSVLLKPGWRLRNGGSAGLCDRCASAYEEGRFCNIFHLDENGWRDCINCKKYVHCGCIMSAHTYALLEVDGIICTECISNDILEGIESFEVSTKKSPHWTPQDLQGSMEVRPSVDSDKKITEATPGAPSQNDAPLPKSREQHSADSLGAADKPSGSSKGNKRPQSDAPPKVHLRRYTPEATEEELLQIQKEANSVAVPLFEKIFTASDADPKNGRLVVPKKCAMVMNLGCLYCFDNHVNIRIKICVVINEWGINCPKIMKDYLPKLSEPEGFPIRIQDTSGKHWNFHFRFWPNNNSTMYVLEGLKDYLISNQCQAGDKVTFYRIDPEGKLVIGLTKSTQPTLSDRKKHLRSFERNAKKRTSGSSK